MAFSWEDLGSALLGAAGVVASPFTGGVSGALTAPFLAKGVGGLLADEPAPEKAQLMRPEKNASAANQVQNQDYIAAIRRMAEG